MPKIAYLPSSELSEAFRYATDSVVLRNDRKLRASSQPHMRSASNDFSTDLPVKMMVNEIAEWGLKSRGGAGDRGRDDVRGQARGQGAS